MVSLQIDSLRIIGKIGLFTGIGAILFNLFDILFTDICLSLGYFETNPFGFNPFMITLKVIFSLILILEVIVMILSKDSIQKIVWTIGFTFIFCLYGFINIYQIILILKVI